MKNSLYFQTPHDLYITLDYPEANLVKSSMHEEKNTTGN